MNVQEYIHGLRRSAAEQNPDALLELSAREWESIEPHLTIENRHTIGGLVEWALTVKDLDVAADDRVQSSVHREAGEDNDLSLSRGEEIARLAEEYTARTKDLMLFSGRGSNTDFVMHVVEVATGHPLGRSLQEQMSSGNPVERELRRGDLFFFKDVSNDVLASIYLGNFFVAVMKDEGKVSKRKFSSKERAQVVAVRRIA